jgi:hypothetical protein
MRRTLAATLSAVVLTFAVGHPVAAEAEPTYRSHPPVRPLPAASNRPMDQGPAYFVDPVKGDDRNEGTEQKPWKTLNHALRQRQGGPLKPGDTLYLRGGTCYECATVAVRGTAEKPARRPRSRPARSATRPGGVPTTSSPTPSSCPSAERGSSRSIFACGRTAQPSTRASSYPLTGLIPCGSRTRGNPISAPSPSEPGRFESAPRQGQRNGDSGEAPAAPVSSTRGWRIAAALQSVHKPPSGPLPLEHLRRTLAHSSGHWQNGSEA